MPYGVPIDVEIVDFLPNTDFVEEADTGFIDEGAGWKPCRVSFTRWYPSLGKWEEFGGYRSTGASKFHYATCECRAGYPHSFHPEEMNFHSNMVWEGKQLMHDPVVEITNLGRLEKIKDDHQKKILENFHLVCRREDNCLFLDFVFEDVDYSHHLDGSEWDNFACGGVQLDLIRAGVAALAPVFHNTLQPCASCVRGRVTNLEVSLAVDMENVHGAYGEGKKLTGGADSMLRVIANSQWLILSIGGRRLAIRGALLQRLKGYWFNGLLCVPRP